MGDGKSTFHCPWLSDDKFFDISNLPGEEWKELKEYQGRKFQKLYYVSNMGRIRSSTGRILKGSDVNGYHEMVLTTTEKKQYTVFVHRAVLYAFKGKPPEGMVDPECNHIDHVTLNNRVGNLEWLSKIDNNAYRNMKDRKPRTPYIKCMIESEGDQKFYDSLQEASIDIGRSKTYLLTTVENGYSLSDKIGIKLFLFDQNTQEYHEYVPTKTIPNNEGLRCRIVDNTGDHEFDSYAKASCYLGKNSEYIGEAVRYRSYRLTTQEGTPVKLYTWENNEWIEYKCDKNISYIPCQILKDGEAHTFPTLSKADNFLNKRKDYIRDCITLGFPLNIEGVELLLFNYDTNQFEKYVPTRFRGKNHNCNRRRVILMDSSGKHVFESLSDADKYLGKSDGYVSNALIAKKVVRDSTGQVIQFEYL